MENAMNKTFPPAQSDIQAKKIGRLISELLQGKQV